MRKHLAIAGILGVAALVALIAGWPRPGPGERDAALEIVHVGPTEVTLAWRTRAASQGSIRYQPSSGQLDPETVSEPPPPSRQHRLVLRGLEPGMRYRYGLAGGELRHQLATQPLPATPFSFLLLWGDAPEHLAELTRSESAEFVLSLTPVPTTGPDPYAAVRPSLALFGPFGPSSRVVEQPQADGWGLDWAGLRLLLVSDPAQIAELLAGQAPHTVGVIWRGGQVDRAGLGSSALHAAIVRHNRQLPTSPVSFALVPGTGQAPVELDDVVYADLPLARDGKALSGAMRLDVGPESTIARFLDGGSEIALRKPPLEGRRTCQECRELADRGAYEESVRAYQEFIQTHEGHYQIDDAHYAIGQILDERLFRFADALGWYRRLVEHYPSSTLAPLGRQRIAFLTARADHDFQPLARFERIRTVELARHKNDPLEREHLLTQARAILDEYPDSSLAPEIGYWLANQYRPTEPDRAVAAYRELLTRYPDHALAADARIEIGETYYEARRYRAAITAFREALGATPGRADGIRPQIARAERNVRRGLLAWTGWAALLLLLGPVVAWRPRGLARRELRRATAAFLGLAAVTLLGAWLIHEQFTGRAELLGLALTIPATACFGYPVTASLGRKLLGSTEDDRRTARRLLAALVGAVLSLVVIGAGSYLGLYYLNEHYLTGFGL
jgi:tetratricopeptide (TPR) repeat protein